MRRHHTHRCSLCTAEIPCGGYRVDNYDGFPPVLCSVEADMGPDDDFICDECLESRSDESEQRRAS